MMIARTKALYLFAVTMLVGTQVLCMTNNAGKKGQKVFLTQKPIDTKQADLAYWLKGDDFKRAAQNFLTSFQAWQPAYHNHNRLNGDERVQASGKNVEILKQRLMHCQELCEQTLDGNVIAKDFLHATYLKEYYDYAALMPDPTQGDIVWYFTHIVFPRSCTGLLKKIDFRQYYRALRARDSLSFMDNISMEKHRAALKNRVRCIVAYHLSSQILLEIKGSDDMVIEG